MKLKSIMAMVRFRTYQMYRSPVYLKSNFWNSKQVGANIAGIIFLYC